MPTIRHGAPAIAYRRAHEDGGPAAVPVGRHENDLGRVEAAGGPGDGARIPVRGARIRIQEHALRDPAPGSRHQLRLRGAAAASRPAGEQDGVGRGRLLGGAGEAGGADVVQLPALPGRVAEHRHQPYAHQRLRNRRQSPYSEERPDHRQDEVERAPPDELRLAARALAHVHGHLGHSQLRFAAGAAATRPRARRSRTARRGSASRRRSPRTSRSSRRWNGDPSAARIPRRSSAVPSLRLRDGT